MKKKWKMHKYKIIIYYYVVTRVKSRKKQKNAFLAFALKKIGFILKESVFVGGVLSLHKKIFHLEYNE